MDRTVVVDPILVAPMITPSELVTFSLKIYVPPPLPPPIPPPSPPHVPPPLSPPLLPEPLPMITLPTSPSN